MTILEICAECAATAEAEERPGRCVAVPRLDWLAVLKSARSDDPVVAQWIKDLTIGAESAGTEFVMCERHQVEAIARLVESPTGTETP